MVSGFIQRHKLPTLMELTSENFADVMNSKAVPPPLIVLTSLEGGVAGEGISGQKEKLLKIAQEWRKEAAHFTEGKRPTVFVWMDGEKWGSWLKSMYGVRKGRGGAPAVVLVDHSVSRLVSFLHDLFLMEVMVLAIDCANYIWLMCTAAAAILRYRR